MLNVSQAHVASHSRSGVADNTPVEQRNWDKRPTAVGTTFPFLVSIFNFCIVIIVFNVKGDEYLIFMNDEYSRIFDLDNLSKR